jgi:aspartate carbamoyltransferase catalytic subunit
MQRLGGSVIGFADPSSSSVSKGENLKDTISMISMYTDVIAMRHPREGAAMAASLYSSVPVVNAGDGGHLHPTQTLTDLTTIMQLHGSLDNLKVGVCGDLRNGRTVHSLLKSLSDFKGNQFYLISPRELAVPDYIRSFLNVKGQKYYEAAGLESVIPVLDVLYMTRVQRERFIDPLEYERLKGVYVLDRAKLTNAKKDLLVMHPLPRVDEIAQDVDSDERAVYFRQAKFGMYIRMALLLTLSSMPSVTPGLAEINVKERTCSNEKCITHIEKYLPDKTYKDGGIERCAYCDKEMKRKKT